MSALTDAPFPRGGGWFNGGIIPSTLVAGDEPAGFNYEGKEYRFEDQWYGTGLFITVRVLRNSGSTNILPGQLVDVSSVIGYYSNTVLPGTNAKAPTTVEATYSFPADEFLPPQGVPPGDLFYVVVRGPALLKSTATGVPTLAILQKVVSCTAAASTNPDAGAVIGQDLTAATTGPETTIALQINNAVGRAMSALTVGQTATSVLVGIGW